MPHAGPADQCLRSGAGIEREEAGIKGCRVLLVEDETMVALLLEDTLGELGCELVGVAASVEHGLQLASSLDIDVAILDVNVAGVAVYPVAERLAARRIPFIFSTGYGPAGLPVEWQGRPVLSKPYLLDDLKQALREAMGGLPGCPAG